MEDLVGKPASFEIRGTIKSFAIEEEDTHVIRNGFGDVISKSSVLRKKLVLETVEGGVIMLNTIGEVKITPVVD